MNWLLWFGLIIVIWSVTRLLVKDEFPPIKVVRNWFIATFWRDEMNVDSPKRPADVTYWVWFWRRVGHSIAYVWTCPWCMSFWVGIAVWQIAVALGFSVPLPWVLILIARGVSGILGAWDARQDQAYEEAERRLGR